MKQKGVNAYAVYDDGWQIWTGFYVDEKEAKKAITNQIDPVLKIGDYSVVSPSESRIVRRTGYADV